MMDNSPLRRLPAELQNNIFAIALTSDGPVHLSKSIPAAPLTQTCQEIRHQTLLMYYAVNTFTTSMQDNDVKPVIRELTRMRAFEARRLTTIGMLEVRAIGDIIWIEFFGREQRVWRERKLCRVLAAHGLTNSNVRFVAICTDNILKFILDNSEDVSMQEKFERRMRGLLDEAVADNV